MIKQPGTSLARHCLEAAKAKNRLQMAIMSMAIAFSPPGDCAWGSKEESEGFAGRIQAGAGYVTSTDQLKKDADKRLDGLSTNADRFDRGIPLVLLDLRYTFASGRQLYFGTPMESGGRPALSLGAVVPVKDGGKLDMSVFGRPFREGMAGSVSAGGQARRYG